MIKILSAQQIREADAYTISHEPIASLDLMERAAAKCSEWLFEKFPAAAEFVLFCGSGNNGGDGLAIARMLLSRGCNVKVIIAFKDQPFSPDSQQNFDRLTQHYPGSVSYFTDSREFPSLHEQLVLIDALFGSGLSRPLQSTARELVEGMNKLGAPIVAVDLPSGMPCEPLNGVNFDLVVQASYTLTFQFPKLSFVLPQSGNAVGDLVLLDIGLHPEFIKQATTPYYLLEKNDIQQLWKKRKPFAHKGDHGHALILAGSEGKTGAAVLCTHACLRSGAGLVSAHVPAGTRAILQSTLPEAMLLTDESISGTTDLSPFTAIGAGPGLGTGVTAATEIKWLIQNYRSPLVLDADALNILSQNKTWLGFLQSETVFTPHFKEFERLTEKAKDDLHRLELARSFTMRFSSYLILKGKYTCIVCPDGNFYFNPTGNAGMAKGGSGDVLTGILTGLLAQGYHPSEACKIGVYIHGLAGDLAAEKFSQTAMTATDLVNCLPAAFLQLERS